MIYQHAFSKLKVETDNGNSPFFAEAAKDEERLYFGNGYDWREPFFAEATKGEEPVH